jgi:hypothetical protein
MASDNKRKLLLKQRSLLCVLPLNGFRPSLFAYSEVSPADNMGTEEFPSSQSLLTSNAAFFVRNRLNPPILDASTWKLSFSGAVRNRFESPFVIS